MCIVCTVFIGQGFPFQEVPSVNFQTQNLPVIRTIANTFNKVVQKARLVRHVAAICRHKHNLGVAFTQYEYVLLVYTHRPKA